MIPKIIHYCWFGGNPMPALAGNCMESWEKYCPNYEIIRWDESNFDISACPQYVRQAYEAKKWAFVTDYVRLKVVYDRGGIYLDTDVELIKPLDPLLSNGAYFGFENDSHINTGLGFGAEKAAPILKDLMADYEEALFLLADGSLDLTPCPNRNTRVFLSYGLKQDNSMQMLPGNVRILPKQWLCPFSDWSGKKDVTADTVSIHWYSASWFDGDGIKAKKKSRRKVRRDSFWMPIAYLPKKICRSLLGDQRYEAIKARFGK